MATLLSLFVPQKCPADEDHGPPHEHRVSHGAVAEARDDLLRAREIEVGEAFDLFGWGHRAQRRTA